MGGALSIALVNIKQLVDIKSGRGLSFSGFTVHLFKKFIILTLRLKKKINVQLYGKLLFTLQRLVNKD